MVLLVAQVAEVAVKALAENLVLDADLDVQSDA